MRPNTLDTAIGEIDTMLHGIYRHGSQYPERAALQRLRERLVHLAESHGQSSVQTTARGAEYGRRPDPERL